MIRGLPDSSSLLFVCISGFSDTICAADKFYDVVDLRPAKAALAVESERFIYRRINDRCPENRRPQWLRAPHGFEFGDPRGRNNVDRQAAPNRTQLFACRVDPVDMRD